VRSPNMARFSLCAVFALFSIAGIRFCWSAHDHDHRDRAPRKNSGLRVDSNPSLSVLEQSFCLAAIQPFTRHVYKVPYIIALLSY
jgi:cbb3-type cytochrome oxidase subunit 3